ncbi:MAG: hypothetical protein AAGD28_28535 [Bacteroidota bacterium]
MLEIPYKIKLAHGESFQVDWEEAYNTYKAVCIRKKLPFLTPRAYLQKDILLIDGIIFEQLKPRNFA